MSDKQAAVQIVMVPADQIPGLMSTALREAMNSRPSGPLLVDKQALAQMLSCSPAHIDNLRKRGLPVVRVGDAVRFEPAAVLDWLRNADDDE